MTTTGSAPPILVCYDHSAGARRAIETAVALFPARAAVVLHVWSPVAAIVRAYGGAVDLPTYDDEALRAAAQALPRRARASRRSQDSSRRPRSWRPRIRVRRMRSSPPAIGMTPA
jgi:hypothetical protein